MGLAFAVLPFGMPTRTTALAGGGRIDKRYRYACSLCFVAHKLCQLCKAPITVSRSLVCVANLYPVADAREVFKGDPTSGVFRRSNQPLADSMVCITLEACLSAGQLFQATLGRLRVHPLQRTPATRIPAAHPFNRRPAGGMPVRVGCEIDDPKIDANVPRWFIGRGIGFGLRDVQIPDVLPPNQFGPADLPTAIIEARSLPIAQHELGNHPPVHSTQADPIHAFQFGGAGVVANRTIITKDRAGFGKQFVRCPISAIRSRTHGANRLCRFVSGPAGLAIAAELARLGLPYRVLERASIGYAWQQHYDRLCLNTLKQVSALPGLAMPISYPNFPSRTQFLAYLRRYAQHFHLQIDEGVTLYHAEFHGQRVLVVGAVTLAPKSLSILLSMVLKQPFRSEVGLPLSPSRSLISRCVLRHGSCLASPAELLRGYFGGATSIISVCRSHLAHHWITSLSLATNCHKLSHLGRCRSIQPWSASRQTLHTSAMIAAPRLIRLSWQLATDQLWIRLRTCLHSIAKVSQYLTATVEHTRTHAWYVLATTTQLLKAGCRQLGEPHELLSMASWHCAWPILRQPTHGISRISEWVRKDSLSVTTGAKAP